MSKNVSELFEGLISPKDDFRPSVMWFWNGNIEEDEIKFQIEQFKKQKIYDFFIHPMYGLEVDYLSDRFFELIKYAVKTAKENGMYFWIYDEYNWHSGTAGEQILIEHPELRARLLRLEKINVWASDSVKLNIENFVCAQAVSENKAVDVTDEVEYKDKILVWQNKTGVRVTLYITYYEFEKNVLSSAMWRKHAKYTPGYIDVFNKKAIQAFLESTYEKYKKAVGEEFGKTVRAYLPTSRRLWL